jgi:hypothetical protein
MHRIHKIEDGIALSVAGKARLRYALRVSLMLCREHAKAVWGKEATPDTMSVYTSDVTVVLEICQTLDEVLALLAAD